MEAQKKKLTRKEKAEEERASWTRINHATADHYILGHVRDGHVDVEDIVHEGLSSRDLTGHKPDLTPIPLHELREVGFDLSGLDPDGLDEVDGTRSNVGR